MRTVMRFFLLSLVIAPVAYWLLGGSVSLSSVPVTGNSSLCERVSWVLVPVGTGRREWVATMEGAQDDAQVAQWLQMTDADRGAFLAQCGKER